MGSTNTDFCDLPNTSEEAYLVGLWCADGYHRTSSIGISNTDLDLIAQFRAWFTKNFACDRLKLRIYPADGIKRKRQAYHLYVNSRSLLRRFMVLKRDPSLSPNLLPAYLAGRFDGDGSVRKDFRADCRILYTTVQEANLDLRLMKSVGMDGARIYHYKSARTFCLYVPRGQTAKFLSLIYPYSVRLQKSVFVPRRDLVTH